MHRWGGNLFKATMLLSGIKDWEKAIYTRYRLSKIFCKTSSRKNETLYEKQQNEYESLGRKSIKKYFNDMTIHGITTNKFF